MSYESLRAIPLSYDNSDSESSARTLVVALNPEWDTSPGPIEFVRFKDGITNTLLKAVKRRPGHNEHQIDQEALLLRAYGNGTEILIDRNREAQSHLALNAKGLAPPLFARFDNGLLYKFIEGTPCSPDDMQRDDVWPAIAQTLAQWHGLLPTQTVTEGCKDEKDRQYDTIKNIVPHKPLPHLWGTMAKWINALPSDTAEQRDLNSRLTEALQESAAQLSDTPGLSNGSYVMAHCDLLSGNVIVRPGKREIRKGGRTISDVSFIDYEYTNPAPAAFDLANHFAEYVGFDCDMNKIPVRSRRRDFIHEYVLSYRQCTSSSSASAPAETNGVHPHGTDGTNGHGNHVSPSKTSTQSVEEDVNQLMQEVDAFRGIPGLYWGIWALIQAMISSIDFDYATYAQDRLGEYWAWKEETDGSRKRDGREMKLRERRWAMEHES